MSPESLLEQLGLLGVFIAGAIPWLEAVGVIPVGILFGLDPFWTITLAFSGNAITTFAFAYSSKQLWRDSAHEKSLRAKTWLEPGELLTATGFGAWPWSDLC